VVAAAGGQLLSAKVARRKGDDGKLLSQGYGFVECSSEAVARAVVAKLQGSSLDGHKLALQISKRKAETAAAAQKSKVRGPGAARCPPARASA
jgi:multiple RNA-binding domain-containing protein 1